MATPGISWPNLSQNANGNSLLSFMGQGGSSQNSPTPITQWPGLTNSFGNSGPVAYSGPSSNQYFSNMPALPNALGTTSIGTGPLNGLSPATLSTFLSQLQSPSASVSNTPGVVPQNAGGSGIPGGEQPLQTTGPQGESGLTGAGKGLFTQNPLDPALTSQLFQFLQSQIGQGIPAFDLSTLLPSSGQATTPGQLNAPLTQLLQQMQQVYGQQGQIGTIASQGVSALPEWNSMVAAMQRQIQEGQTNLQGQFNVEGNLASSPFGQAATDYQTQSNLDLNSLLGQLQNQDLGLQLQAGQQVQGAGQFLQGLDQQAIQNVLSEFNATLPQNNPTLGLQYSASTTFPPLVNPNSGGGILGALLGSSGGILSGLSKLIPALSNL